MSSKKDGTWGGEWGHLQGALHMAAARLGCKRSRLAQGGPILSLFA